MSFFRGMVTGGILTVVLSMIYNPEKKEKKGIMGIARDETENQTCRVTRNVGKTVNEVGRGVGKTVNEFIRR